MKISVRILHRYVGFFLVGIMSMYAFSGIILTYRDTNIFKVEKNIIKELSPNLSASELGQKLRIRGFSATDESQEQIFFTNGTYQKSTGVAEYKQMVYPTIINKMTSLHLTPSGKPMYVLTTFFGISLLFLAISSFWMFKAKTKIFKQGIIVTIIGIVFCAILLML